MVGMGIVCRIGLFELFLCVMLMSVGMVVFVGRRK